METDEQKKCKRAPKQDTQETATVTSDTASLEQKKTQNKHQDISQAPVKVLFQTPKDPVPSEKVLNKEVRSTVTKVSPKEDEVPPQDSMTSVDQCIPEGATHSGKVKALLATDPPTTTKVSTDDAATLQNSTNLNDQGTKVNNTSSETEGAINSGKETAMLVNAKLPPQDNTRSIAQKSNTNSSTDGKAVANEEDKAEIWEMAPTMAKKAVTFEVTTQPLAQPIKLMPKEWRALHDAWLNSTMRAEMEDESLQGIPTMTRYCEGKWSTMANKKLAVVPTHGFVIQYDLRIKVTAGENPVQNVHGKLW